MNINNYMTVKEAAHRWGVKVPALREKLNIQRRPALQDDLDRGLVKYFKSDDSTYGEWIISKKAMEQWYGTEQNSNISDSNYEKFIRLLQSKVGLYDNLTVNLLKHFQVDFIVHMAFEVFLKRKARRNKVSLQEMVMGLTTSEELVFEIFKKKAELDIAMDISEEEAEKIFDGEYCEFYPNTGFHSVIGMIYIKERFSDTVLEQMKDLSSKCQLALTTSKEELEKFIGDL